MLVGVVSSRRLIVIKRHRISSSNLVLVGRHLDRARGHGAAAGCVVHAVHGHGPVVVPRLMGVVVVHLLRVFQDLRGGLDVAEGAVGAAAMAGEGPAAGAAEAADASAVGVVEGGAAAVGGNLLAAAARRRAEGFAAVVLDAELGHGAQLAADPACEDLAALFLAEAAAREVALVYEGDDVDYNLMLVEDGVDNDGDDGSEVGFACDFN